MKFQSLIASIVTEETGTGFVHMAPSHGAEDFEEFLKKRLVGGINP